MFSIKKLTIMLLPLHLVVANAFADASKSQMSLPSPGLTLLPKATYVKPMMPTKKINFIVWLKLRNQAHLDKVVEEMYDPNSPDYHKFLTPAEFNQQYAPKEEVLQAIQHYFSEKGMEAHVVGNSIRVTATVQQIEQTLHVKMNYYQYQERTVYANATAPMLSADLAPYVSEISGLSDIIRFKPLFRSVPTHLQPNQLLKPHDIHMVWDNFTPQAQPTTTSLKGFSGANLVTTYSLKNIAPVQGTPIDGTGQTIIINDECDINSAADILADANVYNSANGLPKLSSANFTVVNPNGSRYTKCDAHKATGWAGEIALDVEAAHTIAPGANIVLALTQSTGDVGASVADIVNVIVNHHFSYAGFPNAYVISNSWGGPEDPSYSIESVLQSAAAQGISINFSSGDCGDSAYNSSACQAVESTASVSYPASSAYGTAIGGTSLFVDNNWNYAFETVWGTYQQGFYFGGGGGVSKIFGPVSWQNAIGSFTAGGFGVLKNLNNKRALPDISMLGDPLTGLNVYQGGTWGVIGGTSLACPLFSGAIAMINQARHVLNKGPIGLAAPYLYNNYKALSDAMAINLIVPPHQMISGATKAPTGAPLSAFTISGNTFGWDSSLTVEPEMQFWNDAVGIGSPNVPTFIAAMTAM